MAVMAVNAASVVSSIYDYDNKNITLVFCLRLSEDKTYDDFPLMQEISKIMEIFRKVPSCCESDVVTFG